MTEICLIKGENYPDYLHAWFNGWFQECSSPKGTGVPCDSKKKDLYIPDEETNSDAELFRECMTEYMSYTFFDSRFEDLNEPWQKQQMEKMIQMVSATGINFSKKLTSKFNTDGKPKFRAKCGSLEDLDTVYKPFLFYLTLWVIRQIGHSFLFYMGFQRYQVEMKRMGARKKVTMSYWYRSAQGNSTASQKPVIFFHGVSPGGYTFYLPMIQNAFLGGTFWGNNAQQYQNPIFLIENEGITCRMTLNALTEKETIKGVQTALVRHGFHSPRQEQDLTLIGHSFGAFHLSWCVRSELCKRIGKLIVIEPSAILLSDPDATNNFIYNRVAENLLRGIPYPRAFFVALVYGTDLFSEHNFRRHFKWYNSELWLEDIPNHIDTLVCLAEKDQISVTRNIAIEINRVNAKKREETNYRPIKLREWKGRGHGSIVFFPSQWKELNRWIREEKISPERTCLEKIV